MDRQNNNWELATIPRPRLNYAALDVFGSSILFKKMSETSPRDVVLFSTPVGTSVALLAHVGGDIAAHGLISFQQRDSLITPFGTVRV